MSVKHSPKSKESQKVKVTPFGSYDIQDYRDLDDEISQLYLKNKEVIYNHMNAVMSKTSVNNTPNMQVRAAPAAGGSRNRKSYSK